MTPTAATIDDGFSFVDQGRTFTCRVETSTRASVRDSWWWFAVSTEAHQRHAPFRLAASDTPDNVRDRIVAYYDGLLARRAAPFQTPWQRRAAARTAEGAAPPATT